MPSLFIQVSLDKEGNMANLKVEEMELPEDPEGKIKIERLQGD